MTWNRKTRREMGRYGIGQETVAREVDRVRAATEESTYRNAFAGMLLALHQLYGFGPKRLKRVALYTINNINRTLCATELVQELQSMAGYNVDTPLEDDELEAAQQELDKAATPKRRDRAK